MKEEEKRNKRGTKEEEEEEEEEEPYCGKLAGPALVWGMLSRCSPLLWWFMVNGTL